MPLDLKHSETSFSVNLTDLLCLRVAKGLVSYPGYEATKGLDVEISNLFVDNDNND